MMRLFRKLRGKSLRQHQAEAAVREHHSEVGKEIRGMSEKVAAVELLVQKLKRDTARWPQS